MGPFTLAVDAKSSSVSSTEASNRKVHDLVVPKKFSASVDEKDEKPFDLVRILFEGAIAGATAGVVVETALYPIDTIKTRLQAVRGGGKIDLKGLYSGLAGNLAGVLPYTNDQFSNMSASAVFIGVYEPAKQKLLSIFPENLSAVAHLAIRTMHATAGAFGGLAASCIRVPTEVVKQRMQTGQFASAPDAVRLIVSKEGFKGLYAFCIYEQLRIGALTGAITTPLDVIKTRLMVQGSGNQYKGIINCVQTIVREEGPAALLKGIGPRVLWIGIGGSIFFSVLESTKRLLAETRPQDQNRR
ncbi:S-adenosylmethionine carrier 1, chloroplastic/mitochondrial [Orobanche gracilis]